MPPLKFYSPSVGRTSGLDPTPCYHLSCCNRIKHFVALLDSDREDLPRRLRQVVSLLKATDLGLDWELLLADLRRWEHPLRRVQRRWARDFWAEAPAGPTADVVSEPMAPN